MVVHISSLDAKSYEFGTLEVQRTKPGEKIKDFLVKLSVESKQDIVIYEVSAIPEGLWVVVWSTFKLKNAKTIDELQAELNYLLERHKEAKEFARIQIKAKIVEALKEIAHRLEQMKNIMEE